MLGIIDWGIGGCGLYGLLRSVADIPVVYFSDSGFTPYGKVEATELKHRLEAVVDCLKARGATHIAVACNAASTVATPNVNLTTITEHGISILKHLPNEPIGIIGGKRLVESQIFQTINPHVHIRVAQKLSAHIESGIPDSDQLEHDLDEILFPVKHVSYLLLACTHYPSIKDRIAKHINPQCVIIDPAVTMANWIQENWNIPRGIRVCDTWLTTGNKDETIASAKMAFEVAISDIEQINL